MAAVSINCTSVIHTLFYEGVAEVDEMDIVSAAKYLCNHMFRVFGGGIKRNSSQPTIQNDFQQSCCQGTNFAGLCDYADVLFNLTASLNCTFADHDTTRAVQESSDQYDVLTYIIMSIFLPLGLICNVLILHAILRMRCLPYQTGYFLSSLALADIGVILEFLAFFIYHHNNAYVAERVHKYLMPSLDMLFGSISLLQVACISIERAVAVTWPLKYQSLISVKRAKIIVFCIWTFSVNLFFLALLRIWITSVVYADFIFYTAVIVLLCVPMTVVTIAYGFVVVSAYQNISVERERMKMLTCLFRDDILLGEKNENENLQKKSNLLGKSSLRWKEIKLSVNVAIVVLPFLGCWGFFVFAHVYEVITDYRFTGLSNWLIVILPFSVSCMNPLLYMMCTRSLRHALKDMIRKNARRLSRTEWSTFNSRRSSSITVVTNIGRRIGRVSFEIIDEQENMAKLFPERNIRNAASETAIAEQKNEEKIILSASCSERIYSVE